MPSLNKHSFTLHQISFKNKNTYLKNIKETISCSFTLNSVVFLLLLVKHKITSPKALLILQRRVSKTTCIHLNKTCLRLVLLKCTFLTYLYNINQALGDVILRLKIAISSVAKSPWTQIEQIYSLAGWNFLHILVSSSDTSLFPLENTLSIRLSLNEKAICVSCLEC